MKTYFYEVRENAGGQLTADSDAEAIARIEARCSLSNTTLSVIYTEDADEIRIVKEAAVTV